MKKILLIFALLSYLSNFSQDEKKKKRLIPKEKIGLNNSKIKLNGFYYSKHVRLNYFNDTIRFISPIILFKNGTVAHSDYIGNGSGTLEKTVLGKKCTLKIPHKKSFKEVVSFFNCYLPSIKYKKVYSFYSIEGKSIRIQTLYKGDLKEEKGVILNDSTLLIKKIIDYNSNKIEHVNLLYYFKKSIKPKEPKLIYKAKHYKPIALKKKYYYNENLKPLTQEEFKSNKFNKNYFVHKYEKDTADIFIKILAQETGRLPKKINDSIRKELATFSKEKLASKNTIVINYFPKSDKCRPDKKWDYNSRLRYKRYLKQFKTKENISQYFIFKDEKSVNNFGKHFNWYLDKNQLIEKTFFKFHYPCASYVIIRPNGNFYSKKGDNHTSGILEKL